MNNLKNNQAFTLIEVLASITILGIVLTIFLSFFSNATLFSSKTEDKLSAINLAEKELYEVTNSLQTYCTNNINTNTNTYACEDPTVIPSDQFRRPSIDINNKSYQSVVTPLTPSTQEKSLGLLPISVSIKKDGTSLTTFYGYVSYKYSTN